jgi:hypothetical protein
MVRKQIAITSIGLASMCVIIAAVIQFFGVISADNQTGLAQPAGVNSLGSVHSWRAGVDAQKPTQTLATSRPESEMLKEYEPSVYPTVQPSINPSDSELIKIHPH